MTDEPRRRGALLDLRLTNEVGLVGDVKVKGNLDCSAHEVVEFRILKVKRRAKNKLTTLDFRGEEFDFLEDLFRKVPRHETLEGSRTQASWLIFENDILQAQKGFIPMNMTSGKKCQEACVVEQKACGQTQTQKGWKQRWLSCENTETFSKIIGMKLGNPKMKWPGISKTTRKTSTSTWATKRRPRKMLAHYLMRQGTWLQRIHKKPSLAQSLLSKGVFRNPGSQTPRKKAGARKKRK